MKLKYVVVCILALILFGSCRSKKKIAEKRAKNQKEVVIKQEESVVTKADTKTPVKSSFEISTISYINKYKDIAMLEMRKYKIPASITLAQGILESRSGNSELTLKSNNHFGIKCHEWTGKKVYHDDDENGECFRKYRDPKTSFEDHSLFLVERRRYSKLFKLKEGDYVAWAKGLSEAGYATDRRYPAKLIGLIEKYELHKFDTQVLGKPFVSEIEENNSAESPVSHIVVQGDTLYSIAKKYGLSVEELKRINGLSANTIHIGQKLNLIK